MTITNESLRNLFSKLVIPAYPEKTILNALPVPGAPFAKLGIDQLNQPVLLVKVMGQNPLKRNVRLRNLEISFRIQCLISVGEATEYADFVCIRLKDSGRFLADYFFSVCATLLQNLSAQPTIEEVMKSYLNFLEIFKALDEEPLNTVQGLWAEIFLMYRSLSPETMINYWHQSPRERFDFSCGGHMLEVKSSKSSQRIHTFSANQLDLTPPISTILVASLIVIQADLGITISAMMARIVSLVQDASLRLKFQTTIAKTLGRGIGHAIEVMFDAALAEKSLKFFTALDISKIAQENIPALVTEVHFKSDLTDLRPVDLNTFNTTELYRALQIA